MHNKIYHDRRKERMSFQEKRTAVSIFTGIAVIAAYCIYAFGRYNSGEIAPGDLKFWATTMLVFIGIGVVFAIAIQIIFHIGYSISVAIGKKIQDENFDDKEIEKTIERETVEDERDRLIELKSLRIGFIIAGVGLVGGLLALVLNYSTVVMLNIFYLSFSLGSVLEGVGQLYYYKRGV